MGSRDKPLVSVLMAAHNEERHVGAAIRSVLRQTLPDFELIVIDDGSTDGTSACLRAFRDPRIRLLRNVNSLGLTRSLIFGMREARSELIARLDADDLAMPRRLENQVAYLRSSPGVGLLGSHCSCIDANDLPCGSRRMPIGDLAIRWRGLLDNPFIHSSVMFRATVYAQADGYDANYATAQDYDLWMRMLRFTHAHNMPRRLVSLRLRKDAISETRRQQQLENHDRVSRRALAELFPQLPPPPRKQKLLRELFAGGPSPVPPSVIPQVVEAYWEYLTAFHARHSDHKGWPALLARERLRCLHRLARAPFGATGFRVLRRVLRPLAQGA